MSTVIVMLVSKQQKLRETKTFKNIYLKVSFFIKITPHQPVGPKIREVELNSLEG